jgi:serine/threonine protein kinase
MSSSQSPCPDPARLKHLLDNSLPESEQAELNAHLEACESCRGALDRLAVGSESWSDAARQLGTDREPQVMDPALKNVVEQLEREAAEASPPTTPFTPTARFVPPQPAELAQHFPQLEILELLGSGGMGAVYKARQPKLDRVVALKILPPEVGKDPAFSERFAREARTLAKLSHPDVVAIHDFGYVPLECGGSTPLWIPGSTSPAPQIAARPASGQTAEKESGVEPPHSKGLYYLLMEFVDGLNLRQMMQAGKLEPKEALAIVPQICTALQYAHDEGVVHRDIKPENILIDKKGRVKIADFGLAKILGRPPGAFTLTDSHQVMGTPHYMAPEQMQGSHAVDHRADIYSLGVVFYEMLTGELPLGRFEPPSKRVEVDVRLDEVVLRTLEREPARRYQQASEVKTDVEMISGSPQEGRVGQVFAAHQSGRVGQVFAAHQDSAKGSERDKMVGREDLAHPTQFAEAPTAAGRDSTRGRIGRFLANSTGWIVLLCVIGALVSTLPWLTWLHVTFTHDSGSIYSAQPAYKTLDGVFAICAFVGLALLLIVDGIKVDPLPIWRPIVVTCTATAVVLALVSVVADWWPLYYHGYDESDRPTGWRITWTEPTTLTGRVAWGIAKRYRYEAGAGLYSALVAASAILVLGLVQLRATFRARKQVARAESMKGVATASHPELTQSADSGRGTSQDYHGLRFYFVCLAVLALIGLAMWFAQSAWWLVTLLIPGFMIALQMEIQWRTVSGTIRLLVSLTGILGLIAFGMWLEQSPWPLLALVVAGFPIAVVFCAFFFADENAGDGETGDVAEGEPAEGAEAGDATAASTAAPPRRRLVRTSVSLLIAAFLGWMLGPWALRYFLNQAKVRVDFETPGVQVALRQDEEEVVRLSQKSKLAQLPPGIYEVVVTSKPSHQVEKVVLFGYDLISCLGFKDPAGVGEFVPPASGMLILSRGDFASITVLGHPTGGTGSASGTPGTPEPVGGTGSASATSAPAQPVLLMKLDPGTDKPLPPGVTEEVGGWRIEIAGATNQAVTLFEIGEKIPESGTLIYRAKVKSKSTGSAELFSLSFRIGDSAFGVRSEWFGDRAEWQAYEVSCPAHEFWQTEPPRVPIGVNFGTPGTLWIKDIELWHAPPPPAKPPVRKPGETVVQSFTWKDKPITTGYQTEGPDGGWRFDLEKENRLIRLFKLDEPGVEGCKLVLRARMQTVDVGAAWLEIVYRLADGSEITSTKPLAGEIAERSTDWTDYCVSVLVMPGVRPDLIRLNLQTEGGTVRQHGYHLGGTVWIKDVELLKGALDSGETATNRELNWAREVAESYLQVAGSHNADDDRVTNWLSENFKKRFQPSGSDTWVHYRFKKYVIATQQMSPTLDEGILKGTVEATERRKFERLGVAWRETSEEFQGTVRFTIRVVKDKDSGRWRVDLVQYELPADAMPTPGEP